MSASNKEVVLITGANGGIGREIARQLLQDHSQRFHVLVGSRSLSDAEATVQGLKEEVQGESVEALQIDITKEESLAAAARVVTEKFGRLDVLHANAGITGIEEGGATEPISETIQRAVSTNAAGSAATVEHFIPLLSRAENPRIIFMTSGAGSLKLAHDFGFVKDYPAYCISKAAENMVMLYYHHRFPQWKVNVCNPGFRATKLTNYGKGSTETPGPIAEGAVNAVRLSLLGKNGESGTHTMIQAKQDEYSQTMTGKDDVVTVPW
ncbi:hypothetical protein PG995_008519 [Apiospora arundinis]|uniref:Carbonyl reductase n=1 Tax=Apiospora arundinis TaxID=335852 RepID=A0ABR2JNA0_9PEZI